VIGSYAGSLMRRTDEVRDKRTCLSLKAALLILLLSLSFLSANLRKSHVIPKFTVTTTLPSSVVRKMFPYFNVYEQPL
jgi:hypothetical protein